MPMNMPAKPEPGAVTNGELKPVAMPFASIVLPVPGEPRKSRPRSGLPPAFLNSSLGLPEVDHARDLLLGLGLAAHVLELDAPVGVARLVRLDLADRHQQERPDQDADVREHQDHDRIAVGRRERLRARFASTPVPVEAGDARDAGVAVEDHLEHPAIDEDQQTRHDAGGTCRASTRRGGGRRRPPAAAPSRRRTGSATGSRLRATTSTRPRKAAIASSVPSSGHPPARVLLVVAARGRRRARSGTRRTSRRGSARATASRARARRTSPWARTGFLEASRLAGPRATPSSRGHAEV